MYGECLSCDEKKFKGQDGSARLYYALCVRIDNLIGFISSSEPFAVGAEVPLAIYVDRNHKFAVSVER